MRKLFPILMASSLCVSQAHASDAPLKNWSIGLGAGPTIGAGFIGRYDWESGLGIQAAALPYYTLDRNSHGSVYLSLGVVGWHRLTTEYIWPVVESKVDENGNPLPMPIIDPTKVRTWTKGFASGPGMGFRFNFFENYVFSIDLPAAVVFEVKNGRVVFDSFRPWPNLALMYNF
jgi:hypothetical protein